jgi:hypothetical protein
VSPISVRSAGAAGGGGSAPAAGQYLAPYMRAGLYYATAGTTTTTSPPNQSLRVTPLYVPRALTLDRIGLDVTTAGQAGAVIRLGIYADDGGYPGALVLDAGTIAGDAVATPEITIAQALAIGVYWLGACVQNAATTQPTVRALAGGQLVFPASTGTAAANTSGAGFQQTNVAGALPATFTATPSGGITCPRVVVRVA